jgi:hypothetical protein
MTGKVATAADLNLGTRTLTLHRRPASSGTQAATQIRFAGQAAYVGKTPFTGLTPALSIAAFDMAGSEITNSTGVSSMGSPAVNHVLVKTHSGTADLITAIRDDLEGLSIGVASLDNGPTKFGADRAAQTAYFVKLDGVSPDVNAAGTGFDSKYRTALRNGYSFAYEFQTLKSSKLALPYSAVYTKIVNGLKDPANNLTGIAYIRSATEASNTTWTRGASSYMQINKNVPLTVAP